MKRGIFSCLITLCVMFFCLSIAYYFSYSRLRSELEQRESGSVGQVIQNETVAESGRESAGGTESTDRDENAGNGAEPGDDEYAGSGSVPGGNEFAGNGSVPGGDDEESTADRFLEADANRKLRTNTDMIYVVGQYDWTTGIITETVGRFPEELLGLTRQELLVFLREHPEYGTLLSFSEHAVYLRKSESTDWSEYMYYLILEDEELLVYYTDQHRIYLETGIKAGELSDEIRKLLETGFYVKDTADLFDYLQTVTS